MRSWRAHLSSSRRAGAGGACEEVESCYGESYSHRCETAQAQERAADARHPQECGRGAEAQAGAAHEEPGESEWALQPGRGPAPSPLQNRERCPPYSRRRPGTGNAAPSRVSFVAVLVLQRSCMKGELQSSIPPFFRFSF